MNRVMLLEALCDFTRRATADLLLPMKSQTEAEEGKVLQRPADVYVMRLPHSSESKKKVPYIIHRLLNGTDQQTPGERVQSEAYVLSIFAVYSDDEQEGALNLLNLMERLRLALLRQVRLEKRFELLLDDDKGLFCELDERIEPPYYLGYMFSTWKLLPVEREVKELWE